MIAEIYYLAFVLGNKNPRHTIIHVSLELGSFGWATFRPA